MTSPWAEKPICLPDQSADRPVPVPIARLRLQFNLSNPPVPTGCAVIVDEHVIAVIKLDDVRDAAKRIDEAHVGAEHHERTAK